MSGQVLDYSTGFPGAAAIHAAGYKGAVRYIGFPDRKKCTTAGELVDFTANGMGMALVHENTITDWRGGYDAGQSAAQRSRNHADAIGFPRNRPIYLAVDQDVVLAGEFDTMLNYLRGAGSVLGSGLVGVYGEADAIDRARNAGVAQFFWQTAAWSKGRRTAAHLFQNIGTVTVGSVTCDTNDVLQGDWGQHNLEDELSWTDSLPNPIYNKEDGGQPAYSAADWLVNANLKAGRAVDIAARIEARLDAMAANTSVAITSEQLNALVQGISTQVINALPETGVTKQDIHNILSDILGSVTLKVNE